MSKVRQYIETSVENQVDMVINKLKDGQIDLDTCKSKILEIIREIDEDILEEVITMER